MEHPTRLPPPDPIYNPKPLMWVRFFVAGVVATKIAQPTLDWLWARHQPDRRKRMVVTHGHVFPRAEAGLSEVELLMEYTARGSNKTDVRNKVWEAMTEVSGSDQVLARVEARVLAQVWLDFTEYRHKDTDWLDSKVIAARDVAHEIRQRDWSLLDGDDDDDLSQEEGAEEGLA